MGTLGTLGAYGEKEGGKIYKGNRKGGSGGRAPQARSGKAFVSDRYAGNLLRR